MYVTLGILFCFAVTLGQSVQHKIAFPKNCSADAIAISAEFIENHSRHLLTLPCFQNFANCLNYDLRTPIKICADELKKPELNDPKQLLKLLGDTKDNYFAVLQAVCCVKTKEAEINHISFDFMHEKIETCTDENCGK